MPGYHGEESTFEAAFKANAAPLIRRIEELERQIGDLLKSPTCGLPSDAPLGAQVRSYEETLSAFRVLQDHFFPGSGVVDSIAGNRA